MSLIEYIVKECGRILLKKGYKEHSDLLRGLRMYEDTPSNCKKSRINVFIDIIKLFRYWDAFPDTYFRFGMFLKDYVDESKIRSFIPQGAYYRYAMDKVLQYHVLIDDKILFHDLMSYYNIPVPYRYFTFRRDEFRSGNEILSDEQVDSIIQQVNDNRIFVKRFTGGAASGVSIFTRTANGDYIDEDGTSVSAQMIRYKYQGQDFIFEKQLTQEETLRKFNPDTVNTIRVLTYKKNVVSAAVRFGARGSYVDNTAKGGVAVSLDIDTGCLGDYGMREYDLYKYYEHPDSHLKFAQTIVPQWPEVRKLVEKTLQYLPYYNSVGFDIATTDDGPVIIEINSGSGVYLSQMGKETGIADYFRID